MDLKVGPSAAGALTERQSPTSTASCHDHDMELVRPADLHLAGYLDALRRGWSPQTDRPQAAAEELARLQQDPSAALEGFDDRSPEGRMVTLHDGSAAPRLPGFVRWMWDGQFCGAINMRWQACTTELPPHCLGHIGYTVVPWKQRRGYATSALRQLLPMAQEVGLSFVEITTDPENVPSQRVIEANGGVLIEQFTKLPAAGGGPALRYRITFD